MPSFRDRNSSASLSPSADAPLLGHTAAGGFALFYPIAESTTGQPSRSHQKLECSEELNSSGCCDEGPRRHCPCAWVGEERDCVWGERGGGCTD